MCKLPKEELRTLRTEAASKPKREIVAEMTAFRSMLRRKYGQLSDSTRAFGPIVKLGGDGH